MTAVLLCAACGQTHPHVQFDATFLLPVSSKTPCAEMPGVGFTTSWDNGAGRAFSLEMSEGATSQQVQQVRACLKAAPLQHLTERVVTYEVSHIERRAG